MIHQVLLIVLFYPSMCTSVSIYSLCVISKISSLVNYQNNYRVMKQGIFREEALYTKSKNHVSNIQFANCSCGNKKCQ